MVDPEEQLSGGNTNEVVRVGTTVRRQVPPHGRSVHRLLAHLASVGFEESPRFLGIDDRGREILTYVEGEAGLHPHSAAVRSVEALEAMVSLVRRYHDATVGFLPQALEMRWPGAAHGGREPDVVCHGDLAPYNMVFRGAAPVGLIDFDNAAPGTRAEDFAYLAFRIAPLSADQNLEDAGWTADVDRVERLRRAQEVYGSVDTSRLVDDVLSRLAGFREWIATRAAAGDPAVATHVREDHLDI